MIVQIKFVLRFVNSPCLYACMTVAVLTITFGAGASLGVITPVLQVSRRGSSLRAPLENGLLLAECKA